MPQFRHNARSNLLLLKDRLLDIDMFFETVFDNLCIENFVCLWVLSHFRIVFVRFGTQFQPFSRTELGVQISGKQTPKCQFGLRSFEPNARSLEHFFTDSYYSFSPFLFSIRGTKVRTAWNAIQRLNVPKHINNFSDFFDFSKFYLTMDSSWHLIHKFFDRNYLD